MTVYASVPIVSARFKPKPLCESFRLSVRAFARAALIAPALDRSGFAVHARKNRIFKSEGLSL